MPWVWVIVAILVIVGLGFWWAKSPHPAEPDVAGLSHQEKTLVDECTLDMATRFHIHAHLTVIIDGQEQTVPKNTGITATCMHSLHTHDDTGIIHIESPVKHDFTLAGFFHIWNTSFSATEIFDHTVSADKQLKLFVDGQEVTTAEKTVMEDRKSYVIMYGDAKTPLTPPANYQFPASI